MTQLLSGSVKAHLMRLTLPSIGGMLAIMLFNLIDTWFVAQLGTDELAAMGFTFSVVMIVGALSVGFSTGAASIVTRALGAGHPDRARRTVADGLFLTMIITLLVSLIGYHTITPLFSLLGAKGRVLELVRDYMQVWYIGAVVAMMPPVSDGCLRAGGDMVRPLFVMCTCAVINAILDPIMIFGWGPVAAMGMKGAAWATIIARTVGMIASLCCLHFRSNLIDWKIPHIRALLLSWKEILRLGIPAALTQVLNPLAQGFYVRLAAGVGGVQAVAAIATGTRIEAFLLIISMAYGVSIVPFIGQNYGAAALERVQEARRLSNRFALIYPVVTLLLLLPSAKTIAGWFSTDPVVIRLCTRYLLITTVGHLGIHLVSWMSQLLSVIGRPAPVMVLNLCRVLCFIIPLSLIGSHWGGYLGLVMGLSAGNLLAGAQAYFMTRHELSKPLA